MIFSLGQKMNLRTVQLTECQFVDMSTMQIPMWLEVVKEAGPLFGEYLQEAPCQTIVFYFLMTK